MLWVNEAAVYLKQGSKIVASFGPTDKGVKQKTALVFDPSRRYMDIITHKKKTVAQ